MSNKLNPLPISDRNSQLQRQSITYFQSALPVEKFVFRGEPIDDAGVDGSLEIRIDGCYTNMRAQVQLKSCEKKNARKDGIVTHSIETSNFNYLLNGNLGLYILYIEETHKLFYAWASDENSRRVSEDSDWRSKGEISIPFQELNEIAIQNIYDRIHRQAEFSREIAEALAHAPTNDSISVSIIPDTLKVENSVDIERILSSSGMTLVASGYSKQVLEKLSLVSQPAANDPRFKLINAYANYSTGRYHLALGLIADAMISNKLKEEDQRFAERIYLVCQKELGIIITEEYFREIENKAKDDDVLDADLKLQKLMIKFRSEIERDEEVLIEMQELKDKIITSQSTSDSFKLGVRAKYLEVIGFDAIREIFSEICNVGARKYAPMIVPVASQISDWKNALNGFAKWDNEAKIIIQDAIDIGHPIFLADALLTRAYINFLQLTSSITYMEFEGTPLNESEIRGSVYSVLDLCEKSMKIYRQANMLEGEVRTQLIMAQAFEVMDQIEAAKNLAKGVVEKAKILGYKRHIETANEMILGETLFSKRLRNAREMRRKNLTNEYDPSLLEKEEDIKYYADEMMKTYKISEDRRKYVINEVLCMRDGIVEKSQWCHHIEIHQDLRHNSSATTLYAKDPNRRVVCKKLNYCVDKLSPDWIDLIKDFKKIYCTNCLDREPAEWT